MPTELQPPDHNGVVHCDLSRVHVHFRGGNDNQFITSERDLFFGTWLGDIIGSSEGRLLVQGVPEKVAVAAVSHLGHGGSMHIRIRYDYASTVQNRDLVAPGQGT